MNPEKKTKKVALVIGSGGLKCAAAIGIMKVLEENNITPDLVVGCSGGSVFGASIALGHSSEKTDEMRTQTWTKDVTKKVDYKSIAKIFFPSIVGYDDQIGFIDDTIMFKNIERAYGVSTTFKDTEIPFFCVATDFDSGEPVVISEGSIARALRASSGIPMVFKPVEINGRLLIDGSISNPLPVDVAIKEGADIIIAVGFEAHIYPSISTPGNYAMQMFNIMVNQLLSTLLGYYNLAHHSEIITIIPEIKKEIKVNDVKKVPYVIEQGAIEAKKHIDYLKRLLNSNNN